MGKALPIIGAQLEQVGTCGQLAGVYLRFLLAAYV
jgi:hypothetical protein